MDLPIQRQPSILEALRRQFDVTYALAVREMETQYAQYKLGYFWGIAEPALYVAIMTLVRLFIRGRASHIEMPPITFVALAVVPVRLFMANIKQLGHSVHGLKNVMDLPVISPLDLILARGVMTFCSYGVIFSIFMIGAGLYEGTLPPRVPAAIFGLFVLTCLMSMGIGVVLAPIYKVMPAVEHVEVFVVRIIFWTSGLFYTVDFFPTWVWPYIWWNPVLHITELMRQYWFSIYTSPIADLSYALLFTMACWLIGLTLERLMRPLIL
jgi:capsular polysaccharide transport system permease protein